MTSCFGINDSIIRPFESLTRTDPMPFGKNLISDYVEKSLPCGSVNFDKVALIAGMANAKIDKALSNMGSILGLVDSFVDKILDVSEIAAYALDALEKFKGVISDFSIPTIDFDKIDFSFPDLNISLPTISADLFKNAFNKLEKAVVSLVNKAKDIIKDFANGLKGLFSEGDIEIPFDNPIEDLIEILSCSAGSSIAGMLAAGLSAISGLASMNNGGLNPLSGLASGLTANFNSLSNTIGGAVGQANNLASGLINSVDSSFSSLINSSLGKNLNSFVAFNGVSQLIGTAFGTNLIAGGNKSASACAAARALNKFGVFDPFISIAGESSVMKQLSSGKPSYKAEEIHLCTCCASGAKYSNEYNGLNLNSNTYHLKDNYASLVNPNQGVSFNVATLNPLPSDIYSTTITNYGLGDSNILSRPLLLALETTRLSTKALGNIAEVKRDFSRFNDFDTEVGIDLRYVNNLAINVSESSYETNDELFSKTREMTA